MIIRKKVSVLLQLPQRDYFLHRNKHQWI